MPEPLSLLAVAYRDLSAVLSSLRVDEGWMPTGWDDVTAARRGTGREPLTAADRDELGSAVDAFPLFG